jgi:hypothetical protein
MRLAAPALLAVAALAGCGGAAKHPAAARPPRIPRALAQSWARQANAVAQEIAAGNTCTARTDATTLAAAVTASAGRVPVRLRARLKPIVTALPGRIVCNPAPATPVEPTPPPHPHPPHPPGPRFGRGHGHGPGHGRGHR